MPNRVKKIKKVENPKAREAQKAEQRRHEMAARSTLSRLRNRSSERK